MSQEQTYTTVPLNDHATSRENLNPNPTGHHVDANFAPQGSGRNTPSGSGNSKKRWSFLPGTQQPSPSFENGGMNEKAQSGRSTPRRPRGMQRGGSWDLLGADRAEWEEYNPAQASVENLRFAEGDVGTNKVSLFLIRPERQQLTSNSSVVFITGRSTGASSSDGLSTSFPSPRSYGFPVSSASPPSLKLTSGVPLWQVLPFLTLESNSS